MEGAGTTMDRFLRAVTGPEGPEMLDDLVPGALTDALSHAAGFFAVELPQPPGGRSRRRTPPSSALPVLHLRGATSAPRFAEGAALVESWFPAAEHRVLDGVDHLMMAPVPEPTAALLTRFWAS